MRTPIDLDHFSVKCSPLPSAEITVGIVKKPIRIAPIGDEVNHDFYVSYFEDKWWLVHPDLAERELVPNLLLAKLYPAVRSDGGLVLIPVTYPNHGEPETWFNAWAEIIPVARQKWIQLKSNKPLGRHEFEDVPGLPKPRWPDLSYRDWVVQAFGDNVMGLDWSRPVVQMPVQRIRIPKKQ